MSKKRDVSADDTILVVGILAICVITWAVAVMVG